VSSPTWVQWAPMLRWVRTRPWQVWAVAGAVFVLFAGLGAVTRTPAMTSAAVGPGLADALEHDAGGAPAGPGAGAPAAPTGTRYPGVPYPTRAPAPTGVPTPTPTSTASTAAFFPDCLAAEAAGAAPIRRGRPGYRPALDRDGDGLACDTPVTATTTGPPAPGTPTPSVPAASPTPDPTVDPTPTDTPSPTAEPTTEPPVAVPTVVDPGTG
jgi:Excalibur calcium-binding domain